MDGALRSQQLGLCDAGIIVPVLPKNIIRHNYINHLVVFNSHSIVLFPVKILQFDIKHIDAHHFLPKLFTVKTVQFLARPTTA